MRTFWLALTKRQQAILDEAVRDWQNEENKHDLGWGCVANIRVRTGEVHVGLLTKKENGAFLKAYEKAKKG